jgi:hypothetical protein
VGGGARGARRAGAGLTLVLAAVAALALTTAAQSEASKEVSIPWDVAEAGLDGESLEVFVQYGGCVGPPFRPVVEETATSIKVTMLATDVSGPEVACTANLVYGLARVALSGPLDGRSIRGRGAAAGLVRPSFITTPGRGPRVRVPNLVGLTSFEARRALRLRGLKARLRSSRGHGGRTQIRGQAPAGGRPVAQNGVVRLLVGLP